ncbi:MAG: hypothetical protein J3K34DRAFT_434546 [Monoraphidium minutum]|nr:MAG: hypothetical protein J3K34DRAFT_434546 [Monoraphidium minutum]
MRRGAGAAPREAQGGGSRGATAGRAKGAGGGEGAPVGRRAGDICGAPGLSAAGRQVRATPRAPRAPAPEAGRGARGGAFAPKGARRGNGPAAEKRPTQAQRGGGRRPSNAVPPFQIARCGARRRSRRGPAHAGVGGQRRHLSTREKQGVAQPKAWGGRVKSGRGHCKPPSNSFRPRAASGSRSNVAGVW